MILSNFTFWISLLLSEIAKHTHRPQGVNYHRYLHVLSYLLLLLSASLYVSKRGAY